MKPFMAGELARKTETDREECSMLRSANQRPATGSSSIRSASNGSDRSPPPTRSDQKTDSPRRMIRPLLAEAACSWSRMASFLAATARRCWSRFVSVRELLATEAGEEGMSLSAASMEISTTVKSDVELEVEGKPDASPMAVSISSRGQRSAGMGAARMPGSPGT